MDRGYNETNIPKENEDETMAKIKEALSQSQNKAPVHKINFSLETPGGIVGMYLMTFPDVEKIIGDLRDMDNLNDDTLLYFEPRHIMECGQIIWAATRLMINNRFITSTDADTIVEKIINMQYTTKYIDFKANMEAISNMIISGYTDNISFARVFKNFKYICKNIWFIPYFKIDEIANLAVKDFKAKQDKSDNNE